MTATAKKYRDFFDVHMRAQFGSFGLMLAFYAGAKFILDSVTVYSPVYRLAAMMNLYLFDYLFVVIACTTVAVFLGRLEIVPPKGGVMVALAVSALVIVVAALSATYFGIFHINFGITYSWIRLGLAFGACYLALGCDMVACWILFHKHVRCS